MAECVYALTKQFPNDEVYGLTGQMRRAAVSIAANIAEGHGRETSGSYVQSLRVAQGSLKELETHLIISQRVRLAAEGEIEAVLSQCDEIGRMLRALLRTVQNKAINAR